MLKDAAQSGLRQQPHCGTGVLPVGPPARRLCHRFLREARRISMFVVHIFRRGLGEWTFCKLVRIRGLCWATCFAARVEGRWCGVQAFRILHRPKSVWGL